MPVPKILFKVNKSDQPYLTFCRGLFLEVLPITWACQSTLRMYYFAREGDMANV